MAKIKLTTKNFKGDLFGGITAGIVALPLALAFGIQAFSGVDDPAAASMGALAGLIGASMLGFFASLFGGTHSQISGPTGPMTVISASLLSGMWVSSGHNVTAIIISMAMAAIFCGLFQILFGVLKIGRYVRYIPYSVISGFMSGIGVIIILQQIFPLFGLQTPVHTTEMIAQFFPAVIHGGMLLPALLGIGTIIIIYLFPRVTKVVPATLVALFVVTIISLFTPLTGNLTIGNIPSALPTPFFIRESLAGLDWGELIMKALVPGLTLAGLGSIDTLLTSVVADNITKTQHDSDQELIGQGIGNAVAGFFCGLPGAGATMRTVVNINAGGRTQISGMIHAILLIAVLLGLGPIVSYVPKAVLAGILVTVGLGIIDFRAFRDLPRMPRNDAIVVLVVFLMTVFVDLLWAVGVGVVLACVFFMKNISDEIKSEYASDRSLDPALLWNDEAGTPDYIRQNVSILRLNGPLFFGSVASFNEYKKEVKSESKAVIMRMKLVSFMDQSGVQALETLLEDFEKQGKMVLFTGMQERPKKLLQKMGVISRYIKEEHLFKTFDECVDFLKEELK